MLLSLARIALFFYLYSFIGWACEELYCSIPAKRWVNRGFLKGPVCPIYGCGALMALFLLRPLYPWPLALFFGAVVASGVLEYFTGWAMEKLFHTRWWDYSHRRFHLQGRVCLGNLLLFGLLLSGLCYWLHPQLERLMGLLPPWVALFAAILCTGLFLWDLITTVRSLIQFQKLMAQLRQALEAAEQQAALALEEKRRALEQQWAQRRQSVESQLALGRRRLDAQLSQWKARLDREAREKALAQWQATKKEKRAFQRFHHAFPSLQVHKWEQGMNQLKERIQKKEEG